MSCLLQEDSTPAFWNTLSCKRMNQPFETAMISYLFCTESITYSFPSISFDESHMAQMIHFGRYHMTWSFTNVSCNGWGRHRILQQCRPRNGTDSRHSGQVQIVLDETGQIDVKDNEIFLQIPATHAVLSDWTTRVQALRDGRRYTVRQMMWIPCKKSLSVKSLTAPK